MRIAAPTLLVAAILPVGVATTAHADEEINPSTPSRTIIRRQLIVSITFLPSSSLPLVMMNLSRAAFGLLIGLTVVPGAFAGYCNW